jgi:hypothetical protein
MGILAAHRHARGRVGHGHQSHAMGMPIGMSMSSRWEGILEKAKRGA